MVDKKEGLPQQLKQLGIVTTIPVILLVGPSFGFLIGRWLDRKSHIYPWFTIIFLTLGFIASAREIIRLLKLIAKDDAQSK